MGLIGSTVTPVVEKIRNITIDARSFHDVALKTRYHDLDVFLSESEGSITVPKYRSIFKNPPMITYVYGTTRVIIKVRSQN